MAVEIDETYKPSEDEPFMSERQREYFRNKLLNWKDDILKESRETLLHLRSPILPIALQPRPIGRWNSERATGSASSYRRSKRH